MAFQQSLDDFTYAEAPYPVEHMPAGWELDESEAFDPAVHLQLEPPTMVKDLEFKNVPFPYSPEEASKSRGFAYSQPFRCLSPEGVRAAKTSVDNARARYPGEIGKGNKRASHFVRGTGYVSKFIKDLSYDPQMTAMMGSMARDEIWPHTMTMSVGHTNVGQVATGRPVDKWHFDSVDYVLIVIISDIEEMEGGLLRVLQQPDSSGTYFEELILQGVPAELVETVRYTGPGYGIFMQGSKILHAVTPVLKAREARYSMVTSYMSKNVFRPDTTKYHTFYGPNGFDDRKDVVPLEFARHKAWRVKGQMSYILDHADFNVSSKNLARVLQGAGDELHKSARLMLGDEEENAAFVDDPSADNHELSHELSRSSHTSHGSRHGAVMPISAKQRSRL